MRDRDASRPFELLLVALLLLPLGCGGSEPAAAPPPGTFEPSWSDEFDGTAVGHVDGSGRDGTEIDVVERAWLVDQVQHTLHWDGYDEAHRSAEQEVTGHGLNDGGWHVFRLDWYPDEYVFSVDGVETWRTSAGGVCQTPNWILLTDEIGNFGTGPGEWGVGPIEDASLPDEFRVDYLRVSRYVPP
jgi:hypothetical protein